MKTPLKSELKKGIISTFFLLKEKGSHYLSYEEDGKLVKKMLLSKKSYKALVSETYCTPKEDKFIMEEEVF